MTPEVKIEIEIDPRPVAAVFIAIGGLLTASAYWLLPRILRKKKQARRD